jgi:hypothetical protein
MTTYVEMLDSVTPVSIPLATRYAAGYIDGDFPSYDGIVQRLGPTATVMPITVIPGVKGRTIDCEHGDASPEQAVQNVIDGLSDTIYCNYATWPTVRILVRAANISPRYWIADYLDSNPTTLPVIPQTWVESGCVAWQFYDTGPYDRSVASLAWLDPTPSPIPPPITKGLKQIMQLSYNPLTGLRTILGVDQYDDTIVLTETAPGVWQWQNVTASATPTGTPKLFQSPIFGTALPT